MSECFLAWPSLHPVVFLEMFILITSAYVYGTQEEPRGKQYVTRAHTASCIYMDSIFGPSMQEAADTRRRLWRPSETAPTSPAIALASETPPVASMSMCRRRHVRICIDNTCMGDASSTRTPRGTWSTGHGIRARRTLALIAFLSVTVIYTYTYASSESRPLLQDSLPRFPLGNYLCRSNCT